VDTTNVLRNVLRCCADAGVVAPGGLVCCRPGLSTSLPLSATQRLIRSLLLLLVLLLRQGAVW
jgi:hypothetical protein